MPIDTAIQAAAIGGGVAAIVTGGFSFWSQWLVRRSDERRKIRELAVQLALENWKIVKEATDRVKGDMLPIDVYLIHAMYSVTALDGRLKTPDQIRNHLRQSLAATQAATNEVDEYSKKLREQRKHGTA